MALPGADAAFAVLSRLPSFQMDAPRWGGIARLRLYASAPHVASRFGCCAKLKRAVERSTAVGQTCARLQRSELEKCSRGDRVIGEIRTLTGDLAEAVAGIDGPMFG